MPQSQEQYQTLIDVYQKWSNLRTQILQEMKDVDPYLVISYDPPEQNYNCERQESLYREKSDSTWMALIGNRTSVASSKERLEIRMFLCKMFKLRAISKTNLDILMKKLSNDATLGFFAQLQNKTLTPDEWEPILETIFRTIQNDESVQMNEIRNLLVKRATELGYSVSSEQDPLTLAAQLKQQRIERSYQNAQEGNRAKRVVVDGQNQESYRIAKESNVQRDDSSNVAKTTGNTNVKRATQLGYSVSSEQDPLTLPAQIKQQQIERSYQNAQEGNRAKRVNFDGQNQESYRIAQESNVRRDDSFNVAKTTGNVFKGMAFVEAMQGNYKEAFVDYMTGQAISSFF